MKGCCPITHTHTHIYIYIRKEAVEKREERAERSGELEKVSKVGDFNRG